MSPTFFGVDSSMDGMVVQWSVRWNGSVDIMEPGPDPRKRLKLPTTTFPSHHHTVSQNTVGTDSGQWTVNFQNGSLKKKEKRFHHNNDIPSSLIFLGVCVCVCVWSHYHPLLRKHYLNFGKRGERERERERDDNNNSLYNIRFIYLALIFCIHS